MLLYSNFGYSKNPPPPQPKSPTNPPGLPIDGGLGYLLLSGIAYGVYQLKKKK